jgi:hypothetical protein
MRLWMIGLALGLAGCTAGEEQDRIKLTTFEPSKDQKTFVYKAEVDANNEKKARAWLEDWLSEKSICGLGWTEVSVDRVANKLVISGRCV